MASFNRASLFLSMAIILSLLLAINLAEGRSIHGVGFQKKKAAVDCNTVISVASGDTCESIAKAFQLTSEFFDSINPNLDCTKLFVGQWLCVDGTTAPSSD